MSKRILGFFLLSLCGWGPETAAQTPPLEAGIALLEEGEFERAVERLQEAAQAVSPEVRSQAHKYLGLAYILLGREDEALETYKALVRQNPDFTMDDLAMDKQAPPPEAVRYLGQATIEVRQEELLAHQALLNRTSRGWALLRSALLPGWGQRYQGHRSRSYALMGLGAAALGYALWADAQYRDARDSYQTADRAADFESLYDRYQKDADRSNRALALATGVWLLNMLDAATQGPNTPNLSLGPTADGWRLAWQQRF